MKRITKTVGVLAMSVVVGSAWAQDCPSYLNAEQTYDCIVAAGDGCDYQQATKQAQRDQQATKLTGT